MITLGLRSVYLDRPVTLIITLKDATQSAKGTLILPVRNQGLFPLVRGSIAIKELRDNPSNTKLIVSKLVPIEPLQRGNSASVEVEFETSRFPQEQYNMLKLNLLHRATGQPLPLPGTPPPDFDDIILKADMMAVAYIQPVQVDVDEIDLTLE